jgi:hypothetical protein
MFSQNTETKCFFNPNVLERDWWFILRHNMRSKHVFENDIVIIPIEEDNQGDNNE